MKLMQYIKSYNIDESIDFYEKIGFSICSDYLDGDENRNVEMSILDLPEMTIKFRLIENSSSENKQEVERFVMSLLVKNAYEYICGISNLNIIFDRYLNSLESVFYCKDPFGNEICITDDEFF